MSGTIVIFAHRRSAGIREILTEISRTRNAKHLKVNIFVDSLNPNAPVHSQAVLEVFEDFSFLDLAVHLRDSNLGLRGNVLSGLDYCSSRFDFLVVLEDDTIVSSAGLDSFLDLLAEGPKLPFFGAVISSSFRCGTRKPKWVETDRFISWGWGTLSSVWKEFRSESNLYPTTDQLVSLIPNSYCFPEKLLVRNTYQKIDGLSSWAIPFSHWLRERGRQILSPTTNYLKLTYEGSGTHTAWGPLLATPGNTVADSRSIILQGPKNYRLQSWKRLIAFSLGFMAHHFRKRLPK